MPIPLTCDCGRALNIKDELAGKKIRCPDCKAVLTVPEPAPPEDAEEELADVLLAEDPPEERKPYSRSSFQAESPPRETRDSRKPPSLPPEKPKRRKSVLMPHEEKRRAPLVAFEEGWFGSLNGGAIGGMLMILIAVVWFVGGLFAGVIFIYPPILFVVGFIAMVKGLAGGNS